MRFVRISEKLHPSPERGVIRSSTLVANHCCRTGGRVSCRKVGVRLRTMRVRRHRSAHIDLNSSPLPPGFFNCHAIDLAEFNDVIVVDSTIRNQSTGIARSRCESSGFGVAPAVDTTVPGASVVGEGPGGGGGGDVVGVGGVDLDVVHRLGVPGGPDADHAGGGPIDVAQDIAGPQVPGGGEAPALRVQGVGGVARERIIPARPCPARTGGGRRR